MKKKSLIVIAAVIVVLASLAAVFLSFRLVVYVYPSAFDDYSSRYTHPSFFNPGYFLVARSDSEVSFLERIKKCSLYIYTPYSQSETGEHYAFYTMVKDGEEIRLDYSREEMYSSFLEVFGDEYVAFAYDDESGEDELLFSSLSSEYPSLGSITYSGRVSVVNEEKLIRESDEYYAVIIPDPLTSSSLYRNTISRVVMDERYAVAAVSVGSVISLHYDWVRMISEALFSPSVTSYYTFSVLH